MNDTSGFYTVQDDILYYGPNFVESSDCTLYRDLKDSYQYPVCGWIWFDSEEEALAYFKIGVN